MVTRIALTGLASAASLVSLLGPTIPLEWGPGPLTVDSLPRVTYVAHRGGAREVPENSLTGLMAAYGRGTAHVLDFDTRMLSDGTLVVMHDPLLNRTTYLGGEVQKLNVREWQGVRVRPKASLPGSWRSERPPTVAQVLDLLGGRLVLMLEAKDPRSVAPLAALLRSRGLTRSVFVNSNDPALARRAHRMGLLTGLWRSAQQLRTDRPERWRSFVDVLDVDYKARDADLVRAVNSGVRRVWAHTVVTSEQRDRVLGLGCDGVITDTPGRLAGAPQRGPQRGARP
ncbi:glycerophosphodiester phosphodiesterase [Streptomyces sp. NBC_00140]|uniref:glycerophosphodiester phosphodiesterase n=1 Tax=Streptomyces sp. NBC_00140 TaxID=2975664 RepID=UPI00225B5C23|nr:glycerophosphodiester phosphodiesterase [Streptomyces sp. NBC_00140]MCX5334587.1 glycerophosphodiester phosphodiesterase [Streptomyces sp. NBC_00140]